jgi:hypothetical protein
MSALFYTGLQAMVIQSAVVVAVLAAMLLKIAAQRRLRVLERRRRISR